MRRSSTSESDTYYLIAEFPGAPPQRAPWVRVVREVEPAVERRNALADDRFGPGMMLTDERGSVRVEFGGSGLLETGDSEQLRDELLAHVATWNELGRPAARDWMSTFIPVGEAPSAAEYRIDRIHYSRIAIPP